MLAEIARLIEQAIVAKGEASLAVHAFKAIIVEPRGNDLQGQRVGGRLHGVGGAAACGNCLFVYLDNRIANQMFCARCAAGISDDKVRPCLANRLIICWFIRAAELDFCMGKQGDGFVQFSAVQQVDIVIE